MRRLGKKLTILALGLLCLVLAACSTSAYHKYEAAEIPEGFNMVTFYWKGTADISSCDVWAWWEDKEGNGYLMENCDYGAKCSILVPDGIAQIGFIVRTDCTDPGASSWGTATKDWAEDRYAVVTDRNTEIYLVTGTPNQYRSIDKGETLMEIRFFNLAGIISENQIRYFISPGSPEASSSVKVTEGTREVAVSQVTDVWGNYTSGVITLSESIDISKVYSVEIEGYGSTNAVPTEIFDSEAFVEKYTYTGGDLGSVIVGDRTQFKVWAPTASSVVLNLYSSGNGGSAINNVPMNREDKGIWSISYSCGHGTYYTYSVTTAVGTQEAVDPYAKAVGVNGDRGMVVDLPSTDPEGFGSDAFARLPSYSDAVIWEVHVRDFSIEDKASRFPGKYLAFTETGLRNANGVSTGVDHLKELGITHVHLQPVYDFATVDETRLDEAQFNWGYDPKNYNALEGSYSTDPYHGEVRINEFKQMIQALHSRGLGVIMDVVYNHTNDLGSCLNRVVPYYYYRYSSSGAPSNGSGCGNETASERAMFRKYMVDSVSYWAKEYHVDGFRFDLMAIHDLETMDQIQKAVKGINPDAIIYGEGWTGGSTALDPSQSASQANINRIGNVAVFNDSIRDGLKGSVFSLMTKGYINGSASKETAGKVAFGMSGGKKTVGTTWSVRNSMVINYMSSHDNYTLWDKLAASCPNASKEELLDMNRLGATIVMLSKGTPFMLAGEEMLRTKEGDGNSYKSSDAVNSLKWDTLSDTSDEYRMTRFYSQLIAFRKECSFIRESEVSCRILDDFVLEVTYRVHGNVKAIAVINPNNEDFSYTLPSGEWRVLLKDNDFYTEKHLSKTSEKVSGKSVFVVDRQ